jgi:hypothetical protein
MTEPKERSYADRADGATAFDPEKQSDEDLEKMLHERREAENRMRALKGFRGRYPC